jgi:two-component system cell cycle response regulator DivK
MNKILIVEDNELNMKLFRDLLSLQACEIITSNKGEGVIELVLEHMPNLILMDIQLGDMSGIDLIQQLKSMPETASIPIISITAFAMKQDEIKITKCGCDLYLSKPVAIDSFFAAVRRFLPTY